jgi:hypothetical protein
VYVCISEGERQSVCVRERESACASERERMCVRETERKRKKEIDRDRDKLSYVSYREAMPMEQGMPLLFAKKSIESFRRG